MVSSEELLKLFLPEWLFDYFEVVKTENKTGSIKIYLDEKKIIPKEIQDQQVISHGFTDYSTVQDFPIKGKEVYLHLRRRKWLNTKTNEIFTRKFDLVYEGTRLSKEFVAFLKATN